MNDATEAGGPWMAAHTLAEHLAPLLEEFDVKWRGHGVIYVDHEPYNIDTFNRILAGLSASLGVPTLKLQSRLLELGWVNDVRSLRPAGVTNERILDIPQAWAQDLPEDDAPDMNEEHDRD